MLLIGLLGLAAVAVRLIDSELRSSKWQARYLSELGRKLSFKVEPGPSSSIRFPDSAPYDERLGYSRIPAFGQRLKEQDFLITRQARISPSMAGLADKGLSLPYREKTQAGLELFDCNRQTLYAERFPELKLVTIQDFGGWDTAQATYFADGGLFDRIYTPGK